MLKKAKIGLGIATIGMACSLVPAVAVSASVRTIRPLQTSQFCKVYKAELAQSDKSSSAAVEKAMTSGNWPKAQKALLSVFNASTGAEKAVISALAGAPSNVKAAAAVALKFEGTLKNDISSSTSLSQYESKITAATQNPKLTAADNTLEAYTTKQCPGVGPTTPTT
jgi:hypothetical protein